MPHQYVSGNFPTLERLALAHLRERFADLRRKGFSRAVRRACLGEGLPKIPILPDGWLVSAMDKDRAAAILDLLRHQTAAAAGKTGRHRYQCRS
jgi:hypothetical protein